MKFLHAITSLIIWRATVAGNIAQSVAESCRMAAGKKVGICSAFGFDGNVGNRLYDSLFDSSLKNAGVIPAKSADVMDIIDIGMTMVAVGFLKAVQLRGDVTELQAIVQALVEEAVHKGAVGKLILIVESDSTTDGEGISQMKAQEMVAEAWSLLPKPLSMEGKALEEYLEVAVYIINQQEESNAVLGSVRSRISDIIAQGEATLPTGTEAASVLGTHITASSAAGVSTSELRAVAACSAVSQDFLRDVTGRVAALAKRVAPSSAPPLAEVTAAVSAALENNYKVHAAVFEQYATSDALKAASYQTRAALSGVLQPLYRRAVEAQRAGCLRVFDSVMLRVPPNKRMPQVLRAQASAVQSEFLLKSEELRTAFSHMFRGIEGPSLLSGGAWVHKGGAGAKAVSAGGSAWAVGSELRTMRSQLAETCAERERYLFLEGAYNPYVRDMPIPPTKLSFHYLLDPRAIAFSQEFDQMYDEHVDGPAESRAQPLVIPGMASIPFDPNDHPVPKEVNKAWWKVLIDFYKN